MQALALISGYSTSAASITRIGAILGLGIAYAGSRKDKVKSIHSPIPEIPLLSCIDIVSEFSA